MKTIVISDVHARWNLLKKVLKKYPDYFYIFLGDLVDNVEYNSEIHSTTKVLAKVMDLEKSGKAVCIQSNHLNKLQRHLAGNKTQLRKYFPDTVREISLMSMDWQGELYEWINSLKYTYEFELNDKKFICAHAYYDNYLVNNTTKSFDWYKQQVLYGPRNKVNEREEWWKPESKYYNLNFPDGNKLLCGHYHFSMNTEKFAIIDTNNESLAIYHPEMDTIEIIQ